MKAVGIIGGMGPKATVDLFQKIVHATPAEIDQEHLKILIYNNPQIYDRTKAILGKGPSPLPQLLEAAKALESIGAELLAIPCNTAHYFAKELQKKCTVPLVLMPEEVAHFIKSQDRTITKVGILATDGTLKSGVYKEALTGEGLIAVNPDPLSQAKVMEIIYGKEGIKAGVVTPWQREQLLEITEKLEEAGAEAVIAGCTELTTLFDRYPLAAQIPLISANDVLAQAIVREALGDAGFSPVAVMG